MKTVLCLTCLLFLGITGHTQYLPATIQTERKFPDTVKLARINITGSASEKITNNKRLFQLKTNGKTSRITIFPPDHKIGDSEIDISNKTDTLEPLKHQDDEELQEIIINSTRNGRNLRSTSTRVEIIDNEELEEKVNMQPGDIRMMLNESTGIQTQQISATSSSSSIKIQGLDGRYTQILKDGFPMSGGFSGGLGLLQTPPVDLKQIEIIKGAASTLYGGGAIAGLVNLISKQPTENKSLLSIINGTSAGGLDFDNYYSQKLNHFGFTIYAARNTSRAYAPGNSIFTAIPQTERYTLTPKLFIYFSPALKLSAGINTSNENRIGGDINYIRGHGDLIHSYFERNKTSRIGSQVSLEYNHNNRQLTIKNAINQFNRTITIPDYIFKGSQLSSYSEISYGTKGSSAWIVGVNLYTDQFKEKPSDYFIKRNYIQNTVGGFIQNTWDLTRWVQIETGLREDYVIKYGWAMLPRISALFKIKSNLTSRIGGGLGYKAPTLFTDEAEQIQFKSVLPISKDSNRLEKSYGLNFDINYTTVFWSILNFSINQLFFYTRINSPLLLKNITDSLSHLVNTHGYIQTRGFETNVIFRIKRFKLQLGYTYTNAILKDSNTIRPNPLSPRHRLNNVLTYEIEHSLKIGIEAYYTSRQVLNDGTTGKAFWTAGLMAEKSWSRFSVFLNFENITNTRQTKFSSIYKGTISHPTFQDIYAPLDGFVANGGFKFKL